MSIRMLESMLPLGGTTNPQIANTIAATHDIMATFCFIAHLLVNGRQVAFLFVSEFECEERGIAVTQIDDAVVCPSAILG